MSLSKYLPEDFSATSPVAVIAGQGRYPHLMVAAMRELGVPTRLIAMVGETAPDLIAQFDPEHRSTIKVGQLGKLLSSLKALDVGHAVMAGQVTPGRLFKGLNPDLKAVAILATLKERNAETIFGAIAREMEKIGVGLLDARAFMDEHLATQGPMTRRQFDNAEALEHGTRIAEEVARLDIGQGVVVSKGTVLAVEAFEGTDAMLKRAGTFKAQDPLFVKTVKPDQDYRFDIPVFGPQTLEVMAEANIRAAALRAHRVLILDRDTVIAEADKKRIALYGFDV